MADLNFTQSRAWAELTGNGHHHDIRPGSVASTILTTTAGRLFEASGRFDAHLEEVQRKNEGWPVNQSRKLGRAADPRPLRPVDAEEIRLRRAELTRNMPLPEPPFWGARTIERVPPKAVVPYLNERMLYQFQWGYRKDGRTLAEYREWAKDELRPVLRRMLDIAIREEILVP